MSSKTVKILLHIILTIIITISPLYKNTAYPMQDHDICRDTLAPNSLLQYFQQKTGGDISYSKILSIWNRFSLIQKIIEENHNDDLSALQELISKNNCLESIGNVLMFDIGAQLQEENDGDNKLYYLDIKIAEKGRQLFLRRVYFFKKGIVLSKEFREKVGIGNKENRAQYARERGFWITSSAFCPSEDYTSNEQIERVFKIWINTGLGRPIDTPLDWTAIDRFNKMFLDRPEEQNSQVTALWDMLSSKIADKKPRVLEEDFTSIHSVSDAPLILAVAVPNTIVFALHLEEKQGELFAVDYDLMSAGKTFAAAQTLAALGQKVHVVSFVGKGSAGKKFLAFADQIGFGKFIPIETNSDTRFAPNIVRESDAHEWHFSAPCPPVSLEEIRTINNAAEDSFRTARPGSIVIMGGKVPTGLDSSFWIKLVRKARSYGHKVFFDNLDKGLTPEDSKKILSAGVYLIKPNLNELAGLLGKDPEIFKDNPIAIVKEARELIKSVRQDGGILEVIVVSLGEKGAMLITPNEAYFAAAPSIKPSNSLGAGDAMVGALAHKISLGKPLNETIKFAVAVAAISTQKSGVVRAAKPDEAEVLASKIWVTPIEEGKDTETWYVSDLPQDVFEFETGALEIALKFFEQGADTENLEKLLSSFRGINSIKWEDDVLSIVGDTEVVKFYPKQQEINERLGLKDRFYIRPKLKTNEDITVKIYRKDSRDLRKKSGPVYVLGIGRNSHDQGAVLIKDGVILGAIEEERLVQDKHTRAYFPKESVRYLLDAHGLTWENIDHIAVTYDYNFFRDTPHSKAPYYHFCRDYDVMGLASEANGRYDTDQFQRFMEEMAVAYGTGYIPPVTFVKHHKAHAASAWYSSKFPEPTLVITNDGRGEDEATTVWLADSEKLKKIAAVPYIHSLGHFYHIITKYLGYKSHDEGKVMGFAPYGAPRNEEESIRIKKLRSLMRELVKFNSQTGQIEMSQQYFNFGSIREFPEVNFSEELLKIISQIVPPFPDGMGRKLDPDNPEHRPLANLAFALQERVEEIILEFVRFYMKEHPETRDKNVKHLILSGGLSLNILSNGKIVQSGLVDADKFLVPAYPGDDGAPVGAAQSVASEEYGLDTQNCVEHVSLGRTYLDSEIQSVLERFGLIEGVDYERVQDDNVLINKVSDILAENKTVAWFQGGAELGPRALGNRSILHRLDDPNGNHKVNVIKNREPWRPSAMSIQEERAAEFLEGIGISPFMTIGFPVTRAKKDVIKAGAHPADGVTRPQTVNRNASPLYWALLDEVGKRTGVPGLLNTSFNRWGPIVETPEDALNTFYYGDGIEQLAIGHFIIKRTERLAPSILFPRDEPLLRDSFESARYAPSSITGAWDNFWSSANNLADERGIANQHFVLVYTVTDFGEREILRVPLIKEMFQRGPKEKIIPDLARRIQSQLGSDKKAVISIETTAEEYADVIIDLFKQFTPPDIKAKWCIVKLGCSKRIKSQVREQKKLDCKTATDQLKDRIRLVRSEKNATPVLIGVAGPIASGTESFIEGVKEACYVIDAQQWTLPETEQETNLGLPFSNIDFNNFVRALEQLHKGKTAMVPCYSKKDGNAITFNLNKLSQIPECGFVRIPDNFIGQYESFMIKKNSQLWVRVSDGQIFEQIIPEPGDVFIVNAPFALNYPVLRKLFTESYFITNLSDEENSKQPIYLKARPIGKAWGTLVDSKRIGEYTWGIEGRTLPVKLLTLGDWVSPQFHDEKDELLVITGVDHTVAGGIPKIIAGFSSQAKSRYGDKLKDGYTNVLRKYTAKLLELIEILKGMGFEREMMELGHVITFARSIQDRDPAGRIKNILNELENIRQDVDFFYEYMVVDVGDIIFVPRGTLHAAGPGIQLYEPQFPGKTIALEDMDKYPVRYAPTDASDWIKERVQGVLDFEKIKGIDENIRVKKIVPNITFEEDGIKVEDLTELVRPNILRTQRITMKNGVAKKYNNISLGSHIIHVLSGQADIIINGEKYNIPTAAPGGMALIVPPTIKEYTLVSKIDDTQIIDTVSLFPSSAEITNTPASIRGHESAENIVYMDNSDLFGSHEYPNPLFALEDQEVFNFVRDILADRYTKYGLTEDLVDQILLYAFLNRLDPEYACSEIYRNVVNFPSQNGTTPFHRTYSNYKKEDKPRILYDLIKGNIKGPVVVDAGAGMSAIAQAILKDNPNITHFISTHNIDYSRMEIRDPRMEFIAEETEDGFRIPLDDGIAHTIIITGRLHHLDPGRELDFLKEIGRILHPEGKVIIIEDAWSNNLPYPKEDEFSKKFHNFTDKQRHDVMAFLDWVGTRLLPGPVPLPRPWNFKTIEEWQGLFREAGLTAIAQEYHGFPDRKFTPLPLCTLELVKLKPGLEDKLIREDVELTKKLLGDLVRTDEDKIYKIRYDKARLSDTQQAIIEEYIEILKRKMTNPENIKVVPFAKADRDYVIGVECLNINGELISEGKVNVEGEDILHEYPLRIIAMLNIAFAASNISPEVDNMDPLRGFIKDQYRAITGKNLEQNEDFRYINLPKPKKIDMEDADALNRLAKQLLTSA